MVIHWVFKGAILVGESIFSFASYEVAITSLFPKLSPAQGNLVKSATTHGRGFTQSLFIAERQHGRCELYQFGLIQPGIEPVFAFSVAVVLSSRYESVKYIWQFSADTTSVLFVAVLVKTL